MTDDHHDLCVDAYPPGERYDPTVALPDPLDTAASTDMAASMWELALARRKQWQTGQELRVRFLDGDPGIRQRVQSHAVTWLEYANLGFMFGSHGSAEIRISFRGTGHWSLVGTDAVRVPRAQPTMQLSLHAGTDETTLRSVVLHEFGHAIGCIHEQASPAAAIPWDRQKVYEFYRRWQGWDDETIRHNVLLRYGAAASRFSAFDPDSIMQYPVPSFLTTNGFQVGWNTELSDGDKTFIARVYPR